MKNYIKKYAYILVPVIVLFLSDLVLRVYHGFEHHYLFGISLSIVIFFMLDLLIVKPKTKRRVNMTVVIFSLIYSGFLSSYFSAFHTVFSFGNIGRADDLTGITAVIPEYVNMDTVFFLLLFGLFVYFYPKLSIPSREFKKEKFIAIGFATMFILFSNYQVLKSDLKLPILSRYGVHTYMFFDIGVMLDDEVEEITKDEIAEFISSKNYLPSDNEYTDLYEGKNLVFVMVESLEDYIIDDYLPTLAKLKQEGMYFDNYYIPRYQAITADSEFIYNTGQVPLLGGGVTYRTFVENTYSISLANKFEEKGYSSYYFHDYYGTFYHRKYTLQNIGYDHTAFAEEMGIEIEAGMTEMPYDIDMIRASFEMYSFEEPFISYYTTVSGHQKYERESTAKYSKMYQQMLEGTEYEEVFPHYLGAIRHSDDAIKELIIQLEEQGVLDNTILVITSDHMAKNAGNDNVRTIEGQPHLSFQGPLIIWSNDMEAKTVDTLASSFDVLPTLANMFGLDIDVNHYVGTDIFSDNERFIPFFDREWLTNEGYFCAPKYHYFAFGDKYVDIDKNNELVLNYHKYGQAILHQDYFKQ